MAPSYKLSYFNIRGLAEPIRFLLAYGGIEYEDNRMTHDDWPAFKAETPMGQMPMLEVDGKKYHQNTAIARCLAKEVGLAGANAWEDLEIDAVVDTITDLRVKFARFFGEKDEVLKESLKTVLFNETVPMYYEKFDKWAADNNGYLALGKLTWVDLYFTALMEGISAFSGVDIPAKYPNINAVQQHVLTNDRIKKWVATRPKTDM